MNASNNNNSNSNNNVTNSMNNSKMSLLQRVLKTECDAFNQDSNDGSLASMSSSANLSYSQAPKSSPMTNEESSLVGDLMNLQNMMPIGMSKNEKSNMANNNNNNSNSNFDIEDLNSEIIDKLFNNYNFD